MSGRTLVAGFGNVLRGDDGFGVEVVRRLQTNETMSKDTVMLEVGTGGVALAQALGGGWSADDLNNGAAAARAEAQSGIRAR